MAPIAYLTARGQKQGDIKGGATEKGREGSIPLISVAYDVETPLDPASGLPTGKRVHKPITVVKVIDQATPTLLQALVTNEVLTSAKIEFWRPVPEAVSPVFHHCADERPDSPELPSRLPAKTFRMNTSKCNSPIRRSPGATRRRAIRRKTIGALEREARRSGRHRNGADQLQDGPIRTEEVLPADVVHGLNFADEPDARLYHRTTRNRKVLDPEGHDRPGGEERVEFVAGTIELEDRIVGEPELHCVIGLARDLYAQHSLNSATVSLKRVCANSDKIDFAHCHLTLPVRDARRARS